MSERRVNLKDILTSFELNEYYLTESERSVALKAMKEACKQTLELACENAEAIAYSQGALGQCGIDKQSILSTINQIE